MHVFFLGLTQSPGQLERMFTDFAMAGIRLIMSNPLRICARAPSIYVLTETTACVIVMSHMPVTVLFFPLELHAEKKLISSQVTV